jgi:hypothetical protein
VLGAVLERALDALDEAIIHPNQLLAAVLADDLVAGLLRTILAARVGSGRRFRLPLDAMERGRGKGDSTQRDYARGGPD